MFSLPVLDSSAPAPTAVLSLPVVFAWSAREPVAVLKLPVVLRGAPYPHGRIGVATDVAIQRKSTKSAVAVAIRVLTSAAVPFAVFSVPVVFSKSAAAPVAVFESAAVERKRPGANTGVEAAGRVVQERKPTQPLYLQSRW